jgi:hypothetical protein
VKIERALAGAARARIRRRISSDPAAAQSDSTGAIASSERSIALRDVHGRFVKGHAGGPGRPPRDCLRDALTSDLLAVWRRHGKQALRQLCEEQPAAYLRLIIASLVASKRHNSK